MTDQERALLGQKIRRQNRLPTEETRESIERVSELLRQHLIYGASVRHAEGVLADHIRDARHVNPPVCTPRREGEVFHWEGVSDEVYGRYPSEQPFRVSGHPLPSGIRPGQIIRVSPTWPVAPEAGMEDRVAERAAEAVDPHVEPTMTVEKRKRSWDEWQRKSGDLLEDAERNRT